MFAELQYRRLYLRLESISEHTDKYGQPPILQGKAIHKYYREHKK